jgi:hypothetical protein
MMGEAFRLDEDARRQIDEHLDSIEEVLRGAAMSRSERQNILDDVETQIVEMLAARTHGRPTVEDVKAVIAELDPPESYASEGQGEQKKEPERSAPLALPKKWTLDRIALAFSIAGAVMLSLQVEIRSSNSLFSISPFAFEAAGLILGIVTLPKPLARAAVILSACTLILALLFMA